MRSDRTKQICLWMTVYVYIYIHLRNPSVFLYKKFCKFLRHFFPNISFYFLSSFNGISTFLVAKAIVVEEQKPGGGIRRFLPFPKGIRPKVNVMPRLEFELADNKVQYVSQYATGTPPKPLPQIFFPNNLVWLWNFRPSHIVEVQSPGAEEYVDCISVEEQNSPSPTSVQDMALNNLMAKRQRWTSRECGVPL